MGDTASYVSQHTPVSRLCADRLCLDLCENIHLHYRDMRLEFSVPEWKQFAAKIGELHNWVRPRLPGYREGTDRFEQKAMTVARQPDYHPGRVRIERLVNGTYHLHLEDIRLEFSPQQFEALRQLFARSNQVDRRVLLSDVRVRVLDEQGQWNNVPVQQSPLYRGPRYGDWAAHEQYIALLRRHNKAKSITPTDEFGRLYSYIHNNGFRPSEHPDPVRIDGNNVAWDGHHRLAILMALHLDSAVELRMVGEYVVEACIPV